MRTLLCVTSLFHQGPARRVYVGAVQLACGSPVPVVLHVDPRSPASAGGSMSRDVGFGVVPFVCTSTSEVARVRVLVENFGAALTLSGTGSAGVWVRRGYGSYRSWQAWALGLTMSRWAVACR